MLKSVPSKRFPTPAKITPPRLANNVYLRNRLFKAIDSARKKPVVWIAAPAGAGKTTLVASYLKERNLPCIWYQIDAGDGDIASLFHYMGIAARYAAPRYKKPLPHLTPEYLAGLPVFTRNFFRDLFGRLNPRSPSFSKGGKKRGFIIVFDNYQEAPADSLLHEVMLNGLSEIPAGINVIIAGRIQIPPVMTRLQATEALSLLDYGEIRLTAEESIGIGQLRIGKKGINKDTILSLHEKTQGWVAGLVLMLEQVKARRIHDKSVGQAATQVVFDYFAGEIFQRADKTTQEFLLKTSFFPKITATAASALSGIRQAGAMLNDLVRRNYFTYRSAVEEKSYEYHPLFREFLMSRSHEAYPEGELKLLKQQAAGLLSERGEIENAAGLLKEAGDLEALIGLILKHARTLVAHGRSQTLSEWIVSVPEPLRDKMPWLLYYLGLCRVPFNPGEARRLFEQAFSLFKADDDPAGTLLAWSELVFCIFHESANFGEVTRYFKAFDSLPENLRTPLSMELEARVAACMIIGGNILPQRLRPDTAAWADRMLALLQADIDINLRLQAGVDLFIYYMWRGLFTKAAVVMQLLNNAVKSPEARHLEQIMVKVTDAIYRWLITAEAQISLQVVQDALAEAERTGVRIWDFHLLSHGCAAALTIGDLSKAKELLGALTQLLPAARPLDKAYYYYLAAWHAIQRDDIQKAHRQLSVIKEMKDVLVMPFSKALFLLASAQVCHRIGDSAQALQDVHAAMNEAREMNSRMLEFMAQLTAAQIALDSGNEAEAVQSLRLGMAVGREEGLMNTFGWLPPVMSRLCAKALEHNIETDYVQMLIKRRGLIPPEGFMSELWPWPIKIYTLGRFGLLIDGKPIQSSKKARKKPLEMLKVIISLGGREVREEEITDLLWPEAEGDAGHKSFEVTLIRLRRLIGNDKAIRLQRGIITLDSRYCFVDAWNFERLIRRADASWNENKQTESIQFSEKAIDRYKGNFLKEDRWQPYTLSMRERLKGKFIRSLIRTGRYYEDAGDINRAAELYQKGIEVDNLCEEIYRHLMLCYQRLGLKAEVMTAYHRCRDAMTAILNTEPSARTKEIYSEILKEKI